MPKKRQPMIVAGVCVEIVAPGLKFVSRGDGIDAYWVCSATARDRGFLPRTVPLHYDLDNLERVQDMARACRELQAEMRAWLDSPDAQEARAYNGTLGSLAELYLSDPQSPYRATAQNTQRGYDDWCKSLVKNFGTKRLDRLVGQDFRSWYATMLKPSGPGKPPRVRLAKACIKEMLPVLLNYGVELELADCLRLAQALERMTLRPPKDVLARWKASRPPKTPMTYEHASRIVDAGLARGTKRHRSVALAVAAQFEFTMRQGDVIGQYQPIDRHRAIEPGMIVSLRQVWIPGLTYEQFSAGQYDLSTSKNDTEATYDTAEYPLFQRALAAVPDAERHGPVIVDESGVPIRKRYFQDLYRELADEAGVPKAVWNARARHGGLTEGYNAIVSKSGEGDAGLADLKYHGQHSNLGTTLGKYVRPGAEPSRRVARARVAHRGGKKESA